MKQTAAVDVKVMKFNISRESMGTRDYLLFENPFEFWKTKQRKTMIKKYPSW